MAKLFGNGKKFVANEHDEMGSFDPIPPSWYVGKIKESEMKQNSKKTGSYLKLVFVITEGEFKDRLLFTNLNLDHPNDDAVAIAEKELAAICRAIGLAGVEDSEELHGEDMQLKVAVKKGNAQFADSNEIKGYKAVDGKAKPSNPESSEDAPRKKKKKKVDFED